MRFLTLPALWLLLALPALVVAYVWMQKRRKLAVRYASVGLIKDALGPGQRLRRHVPPLFVLLGLAAAVLAVARPTAVVTLPSEQRTIILAIDVSLSMRATDVQPNRMEAAQAAAKAFVQEQPADVRIGIVSFAGTAAVDQPPTQNREELIAAIDRFQVQRNTAIGSGILVALATLFPDEAIHVEPDAFGASSARSLARPLPSEAKPAAKAAEATAPVRPGSYTSAAIILLTDGRRTMGPDPLDAARIAADHGVRVYTVGFGTADGGTAGYEGMSIYMRFDEETLKAIAALTEADYFYAGTAEDLKKVYARLNSKFVLEKKETEITALVTAAAALLIVFGAGLSLLWFHRPG